MWTCKKNCNIFTTPDDKCRNIYIGGWADTRKADGLAANRSGKSLTTPCSLVVYAENRDGMFLRNVDIHLPDYTVS
jgi:hypothetical protein